MFPKISASSCVWSLSIDLSWLLCSILLFPQRRRIGCEILCEQFYKQYRHTIRHSSQSRNVPSEGNHAEYLTERRDIDDVKKFPINHCILIFRVFRSGAFVLICALSLLSTVYDEKAGEQKSKKPERLTQSH